MNAPKYVRRLTAKEKAEIQRLIRSGDDARVVRRAQIVRLSSQEKKCREIAELLGYSVPTVHRVIDGFNAEGLPSLADKPRSGRPAIATEKYITYLKQAVAVSPRDLGYAFTSWTLPRLREHLARQCGVLLHPDYLARLMAKHGIVYRRPRHVMGHLRDPQEYSEKKGITGLSKKNAVKPRYDFDLLFLDECEVHLHPTLTKVWTFRNVRAQVPAAGTNQKLCVYGALNYPTGQVHYLTDPRKNACQFNEFLKQLLEAKRDRFVVLVLDNARYHTTRKTLDLLAKHEGHLFVIWLPKYSPELNAIEGLWGYLKRTALNNYFFRTIENLKTAVVQTFTELNQNPKNTLSLAYKVSQNLCRVA